jgi:RNA polymerase subunit RPABC4/transcription elongation factor Spt4
MKKSTCINCGLLVTTAGSTLCNSCGEITITEWFDYIGAIETQIKAQFGTKEAFCSKMGYDYKNFSKKLRTVQNQFNFLNEFMIPLNLEIQITDNAD